MTLVWVAPWHWSGKPAPCHLCGEPALLLDDAGRPAHKVCVELILITGGIGP